MIESVDEEKNVEEPQSRSIPTPVYGTPTPVYDEPPKTRRKRKQKL